MFLWFSEICVALKHFWGMIQWLFADLRKETGTVADMRGEVCVQIIWDHSGDGKRAAITFSTHRHTLSEPSYYRGTPGKLFLTKQQI